MWSNYCEIYMASYFTYSIHIKSVSGMYFSPPFKLVCVPFFLSFAMFDVYHFERSKYFALDKSECDLVSLSLVHNLEWLHKYMYIQAIYTLDSKLTSKP